MPELYGGSLKTFIDGTDGFAKSMAREIEQALDEARAEAGFPPLPDPAIANVPGTASKQDLDNRRILFIAIARGVINHLVKNPDAFQIVVDVTNFPNVTSGLQIQKKDPPL
jgi:hypothetical protein